MNNVVYISLGLIILIIVFFVAKDYIEFFQQTCDINDPELKGPIGDQGPAGRDATVSLSEEKKQLMNKFLRELQFRDGEYYVNDQKIGCYIPS